MPAESIHDMVKQYINALAECFLAAERDPGSSAARRLVRSSRTLCGCTVLRLTAAVTPRPRTLRGVVVAIITTWSCQQSAVQISAWSPCQFVTCRRPRRLVLILWSL